MPFDVCAGPEPAARATVSDETMHRWRNACVAQPKGFSVRVPGQPGRPESAWRAGSSHAGDDTDGKTRAR